MSTEFARALPGDDHAAALELLGTVTQWNQPKGRSHFIALLRRDEHPLLAGCHRACFVKLEPGGDLYPHTDEAGKVFDTDLLVVKTNDRCRNFWQDRDGEHEQHLELGKRYRVIDRLLLHWSTNEGDSDRIYLMIDYPK